MDLAGLAALHQDWATWSADGRLSLGMAWRGPGGSNPAVRVPPAIYQPEIATARDLGLPVTVHACGPRTACGQIDTLAQAGCSGRTCRWCTPTARPARDRGAGRGGLPGEPVPVQRAAHRLRAAPHGDLLAAGLPVGLSVDTTALTGNADMFAIMKLTQGLVTRAPRMSSR